MPSNPPRYGPPLRMNELDLASGGGHSVCIATDRLSVRFRTSHGIVRALEDVSIAIRKGENLGVIGESGSGKTTLGRALVGLLRPSAGTIFYGDIPLGRLSGREYRNVRRDYQIVFQDPSAALNPRSPILNSVMEPLEILGEGNHQDTKEAAIHALERVGVDPSLAVRYPHELSGGQKQRVNIARVLTLRPKFIVCDEVTAALDVSVRGSILNLFVELQKEYGITYAFITHDISVVSLISDRIAVFYLGRLMELGPAHSIGGRPLHPYTESLLSAEPLPLPREMRDAARRIRLVGDVPSPLSPPSGCQFHTRCPIAEAQCAREKPELREALPGHWVACHFADSRGNPIRVGGSRSAE